MNEKIKVFICQNYDKETRERRSEIFNTICDCFRETNNELDIIENELAYFNNSGEDVSCITHSLGLLSISNYVFFAKDFEKSRRCRIEECVAKEFGVYRIYERDLEFAPQNNRDHDESSKLPHFNVCFPCLSMEASKSNPLFSSNFLPYVMKLSEYTVEKGCSCYVKSFDELPKTGEYYYNLDQYLIIDNVGISIPMVIGSASDFDYLFTNGTFAFGHPVKGTKLGSQIYKHADLNGIRSLDFLDKQLLGAYISEFKTSEGLYEYIKMEFRKEFKSENPGSTFMEGLDRVTFLSYLKERYNAFYTTDGFVIAIPIPILIRNIDSNITEEEKREIFHNLMDDISPQNLFYNKYVNCEEISHYFYKKWVDENTVINVNATGGMPLKLKTRD